MGNFSESEKSFHPILLPEVNLILEDFQAISGLLAYLNTYKSPHEVFTSLNIFISNFFGKKIELRINGEDWSNLIDSGPEETQVRSFGLRLKWETPYFDLDDRISVTEHEIPLHIHIKRAIEISRSQHIPLHVHDRTGKLDAHIYYIVENNQLSPIGRISSEDQLRLENML
jgi:hypothetical protein